MLTGEHGVWGCGVYSVIEQLCARLPVLVNRQGPAGVSAPGSPHVFFNVFFLFFPCQPTRTCRRFSTRFSSYFFYVFFLFFPCQPTRTCRRFSTRFSSYCCTDAAASLTKPTACLSLFFFSVTRCVPRRCCIAAAASLTKPTAV